MPAACVAHVGSSAWERLPEALRLLRPRFGRVPVYPAGDPGDAETLAAELAAEVDVLVVFGGDGTVHEVANGLPLGGDGPLVALLPAGTGNDLAGPSACRPTRWPRPASWPTPAPTLDLLDCGPGGPPTASTPASRPPPPTPCPGLKKALGPAAYVVGGVRAGVNPPTWPARVEVDGKVVEGEALAVVVGNGGSFGGGRWLIPDADVGDGLLDVLVVPADVSKAKLARHLARDNRLPGDLPRLRGPAATSSPTCPAASTASRPPPRVGRRHAAGLEGPGPA